MSDEISGIDYAAVLADLERRRDELDKAIEGSSVFVYVLFCFLA